MADPLPLGSVDAACPEDGGLASLQALAAWMRSVGAKRARVGGLELELGDPPPTHVADDTDEQRHARRRRALREEMETRYAHVGGWDGSDEELDRMMGLGQ